MNAIHSASELDELARLFAAITVEAGAAIMEARARGVAAWRKADESPVTEADERAEAIILERLATRAPGLCVVAEESASRGLLPKTNGTFVFVDPLDGTREFLAGNEDFTVNIALVRDAAAVCGAVFAPARELLWFAGAKAFMARAKAGESISLLSNQRPIRARSAPAAGLVALVSRSHMDARTRRELSRLPIAAEREAGSSLKFCLIAEGEADVYPRFGPTMEWDTAAGDAVLRAAGGIVLGENGEPLRYGKADANYRNGGFVAWGDPAAARAITTTAKG